jgi:hypothetical protein
MATTGLDLVSGSMRQTRCIERLEPRPEAPPNRIPADAAKPFKVRFEKCTVWNQRFNPMQFREYRVVLYSTRRRSSKRGRAGISFMMGNEVSNL